MRFPELWIQSSALSLNRLKMDVIAENIANADSTRARFENGQWQPYRRRMVVQQAAPLSFKEMLNNAKRMTSAETARAVRGEVIGVRASGMKEDDAPLRRVYDPTHPDADREGYVLYPNVDLPREMIDLLSASRAYEANVTALSATKAMLQKTLEIGRS
ncbi:MAG: flagellar basal body rod protein FlgC [Candidatus Carbobacillus altaicus]|uniref:Flagellar basal-body rod protein FlgC n=1 Tax=Candidatus Carbonibacillus altaicus TaxID=2163959 RepID=A0A2R6Y4W7_9BACL|nr:flagellar basal body rod protein FlgC [Candidatus Carbobacillus altaicus]PTQ57730.1 MAG: Flagellar basal-body rod protein FlgC [Candidatus Carbobacillus altaicus]